MNFENFLKKIDLFSDLSPRLLKHIDSLCKTKEFKKDEYIVKQGEEGLGLYIIKTGKVAVEKKMDNGSTLEIATHGPGEFIGELSVIDGAVRTASVKALEDTKCITIIAWDFNAAMKAHPEIALEILPVIIKRFRETNAELLALKLKK